MVISNTDGCYSGLIGEEGLTEKINLNYAKDYRIMNDLNIIIKAVRQLWSQTEQPDRQFE